VKKGIVAVMGAVILLPTAFALWMGWRSMRDERERSIAAVSRALGSRLADLASRAEELVRQAESSLLDATDGIMGNEAALRGFSRSFALARQAFAVEDGVVVFPPRAGGSLAEAEFHDRAAALFAGGALDRPVGPEGSEASPDSGWATWFQGGGQQFAFWRRAGPKRLVGVELNAAAFLSFLSGGFPDALGDTSADAVDSPRGRGPSERIVLMDAAGRDFLRWGAHEPGKGEEPLAARRLSPPLQGWEFRIYADSPASAASSESWLIALAALILAAFIGWAVYYLSRGIRREMEEARQRVSFVNQVSHELKAPLTNIRLYADILREDECAKGGGGAYLEVISSECERLSRLIHNVLSFARKKDGGAPRREAADWDETVASALECFKPSFAEKGIELEFRPGAAGRFLFDADAAGQIVGNLVSNAEKYAASGRLVMVETGAAAEGPWVRVSDRGPGIPAKERSRIFEPFVRLSDSVSEGASGSGLGLSISRELAISHGGDLVLEDVPRRGAAADTTEGGEGASFLLTFAAERIDGCAS
jgi:signal transduction histidine kinase